MERTASSHSALWNLESHKMSVLPSAGSFGRAQEEGFCTPHRSDRSPWSSAAKTQRTPCCKEQSGSQHSWTERGRQGDDGPTLPYAASVHNWDECDRVPTASREFLSHSSLDFAFHIYHVELMSCFHTQPHKDHSTGSWVQKSLLAIPETNLSQDTLSECLLEEASAKQIIWRGASHCTNQDSTLHICGYLYTRHLFCRRSGAGEACAVCMLWACQ